MAFYLPQFHAIPENDEWWGTGFTEWHNVERATPLYSGHYQPQVPLDPPGRYSLLDDTVAEWQCHTAQAHGIDAFIYYHYWFAGHRLLETPLNRRMAGDIEMPFAICWANENWTRRWDGKDSEVLIAQDYGHDTAEAVFESFLPYLCDTRYLRLENRPILLVHRVDELPDARKTARTWRDIARDKGIGELYLIASETTPGLDPRVYGFDAVAEFPPVGDSDLRTVSPFLPKGTSKTFSGRVNSYQSIRRKYTTRRPETRFPRHPGVIPRWDNTPRRGEKSTIFVGANPKAYAEWLRHSRDLERGLRGDQGLVFINAWNEWAEGAYLEPDSKFGYSYLQATCYETPVTPALDTTTCPSTGRGPNWRGISRATARSALTLFQRALRCLRGLASRLTRHAL